MKRFTLALSAAAVSVALSHAQANNPNPVAHSPDVFLSNHKPPKKEKNPTTRTVTGQVTDETGQPLEVALVTLTDAKTKEKTTFFTKKDGRYHFEDLSFTIDYDVLARYKDKSSELRKLSQYDRTPRPVRILEIDTEAKSNPPTPAVASTPKQ